MSYPARPLAERFWEKVFKTPQCWYWTGSKLPKGYGNIGIPVGGRTKHLYAHRVSYELHKGQIPTRLMVLHQCDNPSCVNPEHLFLGTAQDNTDDMIRKGRIASGERQSTAKLTEECVWQSRELYKLGARISDLAFWFGVGRPQMFRIVNRQRWKYAERS